MRPYDLRMIIEEGLRSHDIELTGAGSLVIPPYSADITIRCKDKDEFTIIIERRGEHADAA